MAHCEQLYDLSTGVAELFKTNLNKVSSSQRSRLINLFLFSIATAHKNSYQVIKLLKLVQIGKSYSRIHRIEIVNNNRRIIVQRGLNCYHGCMLAGNNFILSVTLYVCSCNNFSIAIAGNFIFSV